MLVNGKPVEIKTDVHAWNTGNVCIEHRSLETHTAPVLLTLVPTWYWSRPQDLKALIKYWPDVVPCGDDGRPGTLLRMNTETFNQHYRKV